MALILTVCLTLNAQTKQPGAAMDEVLSTLNPPCYMNWLASNELLSDDRYMPELWWLKANKLDEFKAKIAAHPDKLWLFWNEPERIDQANTSANVAAALTISYTQALHGEFACCGNIVDGNGLAWLDGYLANNGPTPDVWHIHVYATSVNEWRNRLDDWWAWWTVNGQGKPVIISETSLMWQPEDKQAELLNYLKNFNDSRVIKVFWFSALLEPSVPSWSAINLLNADLTKTTLGQLYAPDVSPQSTPQPTIEPTIPFVPLIPTPIITGTPIPFAPPVQVTYLPYMVLQ